MEEAARDLSEGARLRPEDPEAQLLSCLAAASAGLEDLAYEMMERGRNVATQEDLPVLDLVERGLDQGADASRRFFTDELLPGALRERLMHRP